ncbi:hypothetical protein SmJEL517_g03039 [Synchytrium microbalum]|uniref:F-box domain-containing protein n=1 Tax=Synchytrium microbalum TaxID=1806994 RepID=A0A507C8I0_9FUNG|nr:uncharacterized protein SmJEL517_g03039 [Synchytrium microbalum]TPX34306.1 hypothetical protein SmJEL517_g03039 [Synchytrium microbalum]
MDEVMMHSPVSPTKASNINELPIDLFEHILSFLASDTRNLLPILTVSKSWHCVSLPIFTKSLRFVSVRQRQRFQTLLKPPLQPENPSTPTTTSNDDSEWVVRARRGSSESLQTNSNGNSVFEPLSIHTTHLDMGLNPLPKKFTSDVDVALPSPSPVVTSPEGLSERSYGKSWESRFISPFLDLVSERCRNLQELNLGGTVFYDQAISEVLRSCPNLQKLELGCSSIKQAGLLSITECGKNLRYLGLTGLFRFRRLHQDVFVEIVEGCVNLRCVVIRECPDLDAEVVARVQKERPWLRIVT